MQRNRIKPGLIHDEEGSFIVQLAQGIPEIDKMVLCYRA